MAYELVGAGLVFVFAVLMLVGLRSMLNRMMDELQHEASSARKQFLNCQNRQMQLEKEVSRLSMGLDLVIDEKDTILAGYQDALNKLNELRQRVRELEGKEPLW